jgi:hypothetical protein
MVLQRADHLETRTITHVREPWIPMSTEVPLQNAAVFRPIEERTPSFEFAHAFRRFSRVEFRHTPIVQILTAAHRIGEMNPPVIAIIHIRKRGRDPALGHDGMRFPQK